MKKALQGTDVEAIKAAVEKVATSSQALGASMYAQAQAEQEGAGGEPGGDQGGDDDVVDAEIVDEDENQ